MVFQVCVYVVCAHVSKGLGIWYVWGIFLKKKKKLILGHNFMNILVSCKAWSLSQASFWGIQGESIFFSEPSSHNHGWVLQMFSYLPVTSRNWESADCASLRLTAGMVVDCVDKPWQSLSLLCFSPKLICSVTHVGFLLILLFVKIFVTLNRAMDF